MESRTYQIEAINAVWNAFRTDTHVLLVASCGAGKTAIASKISGMFLERSDYRIIIMMHRSKLVEQFRDSLIEFEQASEHEIGIACAEIDSNSDFDKRICIGTIKTIKSRINDIKRPFDLIIIDEAHSSFSGEYMGAVKEVLAVKNLEEAEKIDEQTYDPEDFMNEQIEKRHPPTNMSFYAFTATPKAKTIELFGVKDPTGEKPGLPFHLYSMRQAIDEGFILDVLKNYITYKIASIFPEQGKRYHYEHLSNNWRLRSNLEKGRDRKNL